MSQDEINALRNEFARSLDRLTDKLDEFTQRLEALTVKQAEQARDILHNRCQSPGACVGLSAQVKDLSDRLEPLENAFREGVGARRARIAIGAGISAGAGVFGALAPHVIEFLKN